MGRQRRAIGREQRADFIRDVGALSDAELVDWRERLAPHAERELAKPADMAPPAEAERLKKLSEQVDQAHERWLAASAPYHAMRQAFIDELTQPAAKDETPKTAMSKEQAESLWETRGRYTEEAREAFREMVSAFDARDEAIAHLQSRQQRSRVAQKAAEAAREHNLDVRRSRDMLHLVEREIEQRRITQLQRELDATEFNLTQRVRMWHDAASYREATPPFGPMRTTGPSKSFGPICASTNGSHRVRATSFRAWSRPGGRGSLRSRASGRLSCQRIARGSPRAVDDARKSYQEALERWGLWRAEHTVAEAHAARRGEGEGASAYRDYVVAERTHGRAQRAYMDRVPARSSPELSRCTSKRHRPGRRIERRIRRKLREAYKGEGEAGRLWKAERQTYQELMRWESQYDWRNRRGRHHVFPQPESAGRWQRLRGREAYALELAAEWEAYKRTSSAEQLEEARHGQR